MAKSFIFIVGLTAASFAFNATPLSAEVKCTVLGKATPACKDDGRPILVVAAIAKPKPAPTVVPAKPLEKSDKGKKPEHGGGHGNGHGDHDDHDDDDHPASP